MAGGEDLVLAVDIGSSSVRAMAFDSRGRRVRGSLRRAGLKVRYTPEGCAELDPDRVLQGVTGVLTGSLRALGRRTDRLAAVAISCFWHSLIGLDRRMRPVTPVLMWADLRAAAEALRLRRRLGEESYRKRTGSYLHPAYPLAKMLWVRNHAPEAYGRISRWVSMDGYLLGKLQGDYRMSHPVAAGTGFYHQTRGEWDETTLEAIGVPAALLPGIRSPERARTGLRGEYREILGPLREVPLYPAMPDGYCAQVGSGCGGPGLAALTLGTSGALRVLVKAGAMPETARGLWCYRVSRDEFLVGGAVNNVGNLVTWLQKTLALGRSAPGRGSGGGGSLPPMGTAGPHGLTVLPFLQGERSPQWPVEAFGVISGLRMSTRAEDIYRAFLEAIGFQFARILRLLERGGYVRGGPVRVSGGIRDPFLLSTLADLFQRPLQVLEEKEVSALGAAALVWGFLGERTPPAGPDRSGSLRVEPSRGNSGAQVPGAARQEHLYRLLTRAGYFR